MCRNWGQRVIAFSNAFTRPIRRLVAKIERLEVLDDETGTFYISW